VCAVVPCHQDTARKSTPYNKSSSQSFLARWPTLSVPGGGTPRLLCLEALICRAVRIGLYPADGPKLHQLVADVDVLSLHEFRWISIMYCKNCYLPIPAINMDYAAEGTTVLPTSKQTMTIVISSPDCYTTTHIDSLINSFFCFLSVLCISCVLYSSLFRQRRQQTRDIIIK